MIKTILTDIEGTTSSIHFVHDVLFPYARKNIADYLRQHANEQMVAEQLQAVNAEAGRQLTLEEAITQLEQWIDQDKKITALKALQGMIWESGYRQGDFKGHIYEDAMRNLKLWQAQGISLYVYSSGSEQAQKLLFAHSDYGDLTGCFRGYFDTRVGGKREAASYRHIIASIGGPAEQILFLSDIEEELDAAREAGMQTVWLVRETAKQLHPRHQQAADFDEIALN